MAKTIEPIKVFKDEAELNAISNSELANLLDGNISMERSRKLFLDGVRNGEITSIRSGDAITTATWGRVIVEGCEVQHSGSSKSTPISTAGVVAKTEPKTKVEETKPTPETKVEETKPTPETKVEETKVEETKPTPETKVEETKVEETKVEETKPTPDKSEKGKSKKVAQVA